MVAQVLQVLQIINPERNGKIDYVHLILLTLALGWLSWRFWAFTIKPAIQPREPRELPYWIPCKRGIFIYWFVVANLLFNSLGYVRRPFLWVKESDSFASLGHAISFFKDTEGTLTKARYVEGSTSLLRIRRLCLRIMQTVLWRFSGTFRYHSSWGKTVHCDISARCDRDLQKLQNPYFRRICSRCYEVYRCQ